MRIQIPTEVSMNFHVQMNTTSATLGQLLFGIRQSCLTEPAQLIPSECGNQNKRFLTQFLYSVCPNVSTFINFKKISTSLSFFVFFLKSFITFYIIFPFERCDHEKFKAEGTTTNYLNILLVKCGTQSPLIIIISHTFLSLKIMNFRRLNFNLFYLASS